MDGRRRALLVVVVGAALALAACGAGPGEAASRRSDAAPDQLAFAVVTDRSSATTAPGTAVAGVGGADAVSTAVEADDESVEVVVPTADRFDPIPAQLAFADPCAVDEPVDHQRALAAMRPAWAAGDLMERVDLGDGSSLWIFGDSFLGATDADGALAEGWRFVNSTALHQRGSCFDLVEGFGGGSWIPSVEAGIILWPQEAIVVDGELFVFSVRIERDPSKPAGLDFRQVGGLIAVYDLDDLSIPRTMVFDVPAIDGNPFGWGALIDDGTVYVNAHQEGIGTFVARFPVDAVWEPATWEFWDGEGWTGDLSASVPVVPHRMRVVPDGDGFVGLSVPVFDRRLHQWRAPAPEGPWALVSTIDVEASGTRPDPSIESWIYEPLLIGDGSPAEVAVNYLPVDPSVIPGDVDLYGPRFVEVDLGLR